MLIIFETTKQHTLQNIRCMCVGHRKTTTLFAPAMHSRAVAKPAQIFKFSESTGFPAARRKGTAPPQHLKGHSGLKVTRLGRDGKAKK